MSFKIPCGGFMLGEGLVLSEDGKTLNVSGGGGDDVYTVKRITNVETGKQELQGDYAGALAAYESGKSLKFVEAEVESGEEFVFCESFSYFYSPASSKFKFVGYSDSNFITYTLTDSGVTGGNDLTYIQELNIEAPGGLLLNSSTAGSTKVFRVKVSDTGELSATEVT